MLVKKDTSACTELFSGYEFFCIDD